MPQRRTVQPWDEKIRNEIRDLRSKELKLHWEEHRNAKQQEVAQAAIASIEILRHRWRLAEEMRAHEQEHDRMTRVKTLDDSKLRLNHKREVKQLAQNQDASYVLESLKYSADNSKSQSDLAKSTACRDSERALQRADSLRHLARARISQKIDEKRRDDNDRAHDVRIEQANQVNELVKKRDELRNRVELARVAHGRAPAPIALQARGLFSDPYRSLSPHRSLGSPISTERAEPICPWLLENHVIGSVDLDVA